MAQYYRFSLRQFGGIVAPTLVLLAGMHVLLHLASLLDCLPGPPTGVVPETTLIKHQSRACRRDSGASILLLGDSTCLGGVDSLALSEQLPGQPPVLSLALVVNFDLTVYAEELADYAAANPGRVRAAVLLVTPPKLGGMGLDDSSSRMWAQVHHPEPPASRQRLAAFQNGWSGDDLLRLNLLSHVLATPLHGKGAELYGFGSGVDSYLTLHHGDIANLGEMAPPKTDRRSLAPALDTFEPWPLAPKIEAHSRVFTPWCRAELNSLSD